MNQINSSIIAVAGNCHTFAAVAALAAALLTSNVTAQTPQTYATGSVNQLGWLTGCWQGRTERDGSTMNETWFSPRGNSAMGVGLTYLDGKTISSESMRMYDQGDSIKLSLHPAGRSEVTMNLESIGEKAVAFSVTEKEVTTKLRYEKKGEKEISATLRIEQGARGRGADYSFARVDCAVFFSPLPKEAATTAPKDRDKQ